jgi:hypothetical protein
VAVYGVELGAEYRCWTVDLAEMGERDLWVCAKRVRQLLFLPREAIAICRVPSRHVQCSAVQRPTLSARMSGARRKRRSKPRGEKVSSLQ